MEVFFFTRDSSIAWKLKKVVYNDLGKLSWNRIFETQLFEAVKKVLQIPRRNRQDIAPLKEWPWTEFH